MTSVRIDLEISAKKILNHLVIKNETIEEQVSKGIQLAIDDLTKGDNFINHVRESTKVEIGRIIHSVVLSYDIRNKITKSVSDAIDKKIQCYSDKLADKIVNVIGDEKDK